MNVCLGYLDTLIPNNDSISMKDLIEYLIAAPYHTYHDIHLP